MADERGPNLSIDELLRLGQIGLEQGLWADAERYFQRAYDLDPECVPALRGLAQAVRDTDEAERWALRAQELSPGDEQIHAILEQMRARGTSTTPQIRFAASGRSQGPSALWLAAALVAAAILVAGAMALIIQSSRKAPLVEHGEPGGTMPMGMTATPPSTTRIVAKPSPSPDGRLRAQQATTLILAPVSGTDQVSRGSGALVDSRGLVLTSLHVLEAEPGILANDQGAALVGMSSSPQHAPDVWYVGVELARESNADLIILALVAKLGEGPFHVTSILWGDGQALAPGQEIVGLGYPALGGDTLTWASGTVAGYATSTLGVAMAKTEASFLPGSSGGPVVDGNGALVGIISTAYTDVESQGRLSYFVLEQNARDLVARARGLVPPPHDLNWILAEADSIIQGRR